MMLTFFCQIQLSTIIVLLLSASAHSCSSFFPFPHMLCLRITLKFLPSHSFPWDAKARKLHFEEAMVFSVFLSYEMTEKSNW